MKGPKYRKWLESERGWYDLTRRAKHLGLELDLPLQDAIEDQMVRSYADLQQLANGVPLAWLVEFTSQRYEFLIPPMSPFGGYVRATFEVLEEADTDTVLMALLKEARGET